MNGRMPWPIEVRRSRIDSAYFTVSFFKAFIR